MYILICTLDKQYLNYKITLVQTKIIRQNVSVNDMKKPQLKNPRSYQIREALTFKRIVIKFLMSRFGEIVRSLSTYFQVGSLTLTSTIARYTRRLDSRLPETREITFLPQFKSISAVNPCETRFPLDVAQRP